MKCPIQMPAHNRHRHVPALRWRHEHHTLEARDAGRPGWPPGASHHLAGMRDSRHIVAINPDARAPIHDVAHLSLRTDLHTAIPAIRAVLRRRRGRDA